LATALPARPSAAKAAVGVNFILMNVLNAERMNGRKFVSSLDN
jgi:hypothetical protein